MLISLQEAGTMGVGVPALQVNLDGNSDLPRFPIQPLPTGTHRSAAVENHLIQRQRQAFYPIHNFVDSS